MKTNKLPKIERSVLEHFDATMRNSNFYNLECRLENTQEYLDVYFLRKDTTKDLSKLEWYKDDRRKIWSLVEVTNIPEAYLSAITEFCKVETVRKYFKVEEAVLYEILDKPIIVAVYYNTLVLFMLCKEDKGNDVTLH